MKFFFTLTVLLIACFCLSAQTKQEKIPFKDKYNTTFIFTTVANGDFIITRKFSRKEAEIRHYNADAELKHAYWIDNIKGGHCEIIASPDGKYIYMIDQIIMVEGYGRSTPGPVYGITQLANGTNFQITSAKKDLKKLDISAIFISPKGLCLLNTFERDMTYSARNRIYMVDHKTRGAGFTDLKLDARQTTSDKTNWLYSANDIGNIYLYNKSVDFEEKTYKVEVAVLDNDFKVERVYDFSSFIDNYFMPADYCIANSAEYQYYSGYPGIRYYVGVLTDTTDQSTYVLSNYGRIGTFKDSKNKVQVDVDNTVIDGLLIEKFDYDGEKKWYSFYEYEPQIPVKTSGVIASLILPESGNIKFAQETLLVGEKKRQIRKVEFTSEGKFIKEFGYEINNKLNIGAKSMLQCQSEYLEPVKIKDDYNAHNQIEVFDTGKGTVVVYKDAEDKNIVLEFF